jgi:sugar phosphate isomerase/epimerase
VREIRRLLDRYGLRGIGSHIGLTQFRDNLTQVLDDAQTLGLSYAGTANTPDALFPPAERNTPDAYRRAAELFNQFGAAAKARGIRFYQHNHAGEFAIVDGTRLWDVVIAETDPALVSFEIDIYWACTRGSSVADAHHRTPQRPATHRLPWRARTTRFSVPASGVSTTRAGMGSRNAPDAPWRKRSDTHLREGA